MTSKFKNRTIYERRARRQSSRASGSATPPKEHVPAQLFQEDSTATRVDPYLSFDDIIGTIREQAPLDTPEPTSRQYTNWLWDTAYARLTAKDPDLIRQFEADVSAYTTNTQTEPKGTTIASSSGDPQSRTDALGFEVPSERVPMVQFLDAFLGENENTECGDSGQDEEIHQGQNDNQFNTSRKSMTKLRALVWAHKHTLIPWVASCLALNRLLQPSGQSDKVQSTVISLICKMEWYIGLSRLCFQSALLSPQSFPGDSSLNLRQGALLFLYEAILSYQIGAAFFAFDERENQHHFDASELHIIEENIKAREEALMNFGQQGLRSELNNTINDAIRLDQDKHLVDGEFEAMMEKQPTRLEQLLDRLNVGRQPSTRRIDGTSPGPELYEWARTTDSYKNFIKWDAEASDQVLWLVGHPGTGKTALLDVVVQELPLNHEAQGNHSPMPPRDVAYFFCGSRIRQQDSALYVIKGIICQVISGRPSLRKLLDDKFNDTNRDEFDDTNDFRAMSMLLYRLLDDENFPQMYFVVDGIEELSVGKPFGLSTVSMQYRGGGPGDSLDDCEATKLFNLISTTVRVSKKVKWLVSVDSEMYTRYRIASQYGQTCLVIDSETEPIRKIAHAWTIERIPEIADKIHNNETLFAKLTEKVQNSSVGNYLWLKMALNLSSASVAPWNAPQIFEELSTSTTVVSLYSRLKKDLSRLSEHDLAYCEALLSTASIAHRPLLVAELADIVNLPAEVDAAVIIGQFLSPFLELRQDSSSEDEVVCFVHYAAKDFVQRDTQTQGQSKAQLKMAKSCLHILLEDLGCKHTILSPRNLVDKSRSLNDYAASFWVRHWSVLDEDGREATAELAKHLLVEHEAEWLEQLDSRKLLLEVLQLTEKINYSSTIKTRWPSTNNTDQVHQTIRNLSIFFRVHRQWTSDSQRRDYGEDDGPSELKNSLLFWPGANTPWLVQAPVIDVRDRAVASCLHILEHAGWTRCCRFSPDGRMVATSSDDRLVRLWDTETGKLQHVYGKTNSTAYDMALSRSGPDCQALVVASDRRSITIWELFTGILVQVLTDVDEDVIKSQDMAHGDETTRDSSNEDHGQLDGVEDVIDTSDGSSDGRSDSPRPYPAWITCLDISPNGDKLVAITNQSLFVWSLPDFQRRRWDWNFDKQKSEDIAQSSIKFSPDGLLVALSVGSGISIRKAENGVEIVKLLLGEAPENEKFELQELSVRESHPEKDSAEDGHSTAGSANSSADMRGDTISCLTFSPDSRLLASGSMDGTTRIWDVQIGQLVLVLRQNWEQCSGEMIDDLSFSADGTLLATATEDSIIVWKQNTLDSWSHGPNRYRPHHILDGQRSRVFSVDFAPHGNLLVSASDDSGVRIWDLDAWGDCVTGEEEEETDHHLQPLPAYHWMDSSILCVSVSNDGNTIASGSYSGKVCLWDGITGIRRRLLEMTHMGSVLSLAFSLDGKHLISTSEDETAAMWKVNGESTSSQIQFKGHEDWVRGATISPDGRLAATASDDKTVRVWDISATTESGSLLDQEADQEVSSGVFKGHSDYVFSVAFSPDGHHLASVGDDCHVMIWHITGVGDKSKPDKEMSDTRLTRYMRGVVFTADGNRIITVSSDGSVALWEPTLPDGSRCLMVWDTDQPFTSMHIDQDRPNMLLTEFGAWPLNISTIELDKVAIGASSELPQLEVSPMRSPVSISSDKKWILWNNEKRIFVPWEFRPTTRWSFQIRGLCVVVGCSSGKILLFRLSEDQGSFDHEYMQREGSEDILFEA